MFPPHQGCPIQHPDSSPSTHPILALACLAGRTPPSGLGMPASGLGMPASGLGMPASGIIYPPTPPKAGGALRPLGPGGGRGACPAFYTYTVGI